ncbi:MAG: agmatinase [Candidatus Omnitrophica bacterium]|nr:agmatinase [Candidatus Omnitrophota bacterium]
MNEEIMDKRFGGEQIKPEYAGFKKAKAVIIPCPYDTTASYKKGTQKGPRAVLDASEHIELYDEELKSETYKIGIFTREPLNLESLDPENMVNKVKDEVAEVLKAEKMPVIIGGEHTVSVGAVTAAAKVYKDLSVLHLDAHHDLRDEYDGTRLSHACVTRRFLEKCPVVQTGTRSLSKEEQDFIGTSPPNLKTVNVYEIIDNASWKEDVVRSLSENVYISLDLDVFDPSMMPSVGTPEPGGIGWYELLDLLKMVTKAKKIIGFDVVELMPIENLTAPDFLTAKLIYRLLGYIFSGKK